MPPPCSACQYDFAGPTGRGGLPTSCLRCWNRLSCSPIASSITTASGLVIWAGSSSSAGATAEARISERGVCSPGVLKPPAGGQFETQDTAIVPGSWHISLVILSDDELSPSRLQQCRRLEPPPLRTCLAYLRFRHICWSRACTTRSTLPG